MATRIWLSKRGIEKIEKGIPGAADRFMGMSVRRENGAPYVEIFEDVTSPTTQVPRFPRGTVRCVTFVTSIHTCFRKDGDYRKGQAFGRVVTVRSVTGSAQPIEVVRQDISIRAPTVTAAIDLYERIRDGVVQTCSYWGDKIEETA